MIVAEQILILIPVANNADITGWIGQRINQLGYSGQGILSQGVSDQFDPCREHYQEKLSQIVNAKLKQ